MSGKRSTLSLLRTFLLVGMATVTAGAIAQSPQPNIGGQIQVDSQAVGFPRLVETSIAAVSRSGEPDALVANWIYNHPTNLTTKNGVAISEDGGFTWSNDNLIQGWYSDPMACSDQRTGSLWVGVSHLSGATPGIHVAKWNGGSGFHSPVSPVSGQVCDKAFMAAGPRRNQPGTTRLYVSFWSDVGGPVRQYITWSDSFGVAGSWAPPIQLPQPPSNPIWGNATLLENRRVTFSVCARQRLRPCAQSLRAGSRYGCRRCPRQSSATPRAGPRRGRFRVWPSFR